MKPIEIQISARVQAPRNGRPLSERLMREAITARSEGIIVKGIDLTIVRWRHGTQALWIETDEDQDTLWAKFRRVLQESTLYVEQKPALRDR